MMKPSRSFVTHLKCEAGEGTIGQLQGVGGGGAGAAGGIRAGGGGDGPTGGDSKFQP